MVLKISLCSHFQRLWLLLIYCFLIFLLFWSTGFDMVILMLGIVMVGTLIVPTVIVHLNHYKYCRGRRVVLLDDMIEIRGVGSVLAVSVKEITCITVYMSGARYSNLAIQSFPFENYFYCKIDTVASDPLFLPGLFSDNLDKLLEVRYKVPFVRERKYYPIIG
ncbi:hypothetical protein K7A41_00340 [Sphingobacterium sp. InxBP1]|uniref:hypothetical protein n=1 Tax=Sphingobacterium sp. InxBP1 TaxID=2870328 RepID=UPI002244280D|nr:hypothetical protein [Sphingobacterium sp. InxBP1]MCW8309669.1 hypothetical protein [Sphingobacterium sp. InxBP1]